MQATGRPGSMPIDFWAPDSMRLAYVTQGSAAKHNLHRLNRLHRQLQ